MNCYSFRIQYVPRNKANGSRKALQYARGRTVRCRSETEALGIIFKPWNSERVVEIPRPKAPTTFERPVMYSRNGTPERTDAGVERGYVRATSGSRRHGEPNLGAPGRGVRSTSSGIGSPDTKKLF
ncbi:hypothetical protein GWI33_015690 [Rhynchophorus ferrugineus]|uniref:Uncharacterized protein n=1 Tax=Rhynchophorus ferrugineus TaxID=354439 RepID=A0A834I3W0_RHYFE|nr:hypothetical protein GWI33_015690 [Rhynchophorus ferrugineus]